MTMTGSIGYRAGALLLVLLAVRLWPADVSWFDALPGKILSAPGNLGGLLVSAGEDIVDGLLHGIESAAGGLLSTVRGLASDVTGAFKSVLAGMARA